MKFIVLLLILIACAPQQNSGTAIQSKIIGGTPVNFTQWANVVKINMGTYGGSCTGTVISKRVVLTAGHCVKGNLPSIYRITVKDPKNLFNNKTYRVESSRHHAMYNNNSSMQNFDIAYLYLTEDFILPENLIVPLITDEELKTISIAQELTMVGYGITDNGSSGKKMAVNIPLTSISKTEMTAGNATNNTCQGDSGGPAFVTLANGEMRQIGITSRGERECRGRGIYELTTMARPWIDSDLLFLKGKKLYDQGKYEEAKEIFTESLSFFPLYATTYSYIAACSKKLGDEETFEEYTAFAGEVKLFLEQRITHYYLSIFNFGIKTPSNYIDYGCDVQVDSSPFMSGEEFFYMNFSCGPKVKVSYNNLYYDIKDNNIEALYVYESVKHKVTVHFPEEVQSEEAETAMLKLFKCSNLNSCSSTISAELSFSGYSKQFRLIDTKGLNRDQINLRWNHEL